MVAKKVIIDQLKKIGFDTNGWGRSEVAQLHEIILEGEEIFEAVNGIYDGGFALLLATNIRVLLVDKKPLNYLTVEDMRFDMISEMDYNHRLLGAYISISSGDKNLRFRSYNQPKLRKLIGHVQHCMAESKQKQDTHAQGQIQHLEAINKQLQQYLIAQQNYQQQVVQSNITAQQALPEPPRPSHELADFLYAQKLLENHNLNDAQVLPEQTKTLIEQAAANTKQLTTSNEDNPTMVSNRDLMDIYNIGKKEIFSEIEHKSKLNQIIPVSSKISLNIPTEIHPLQIAYSKLPMILKSRKLSLNGGPKQINDVPFTYPSEV